MLSKNFQKIYFVTCAIVSSPFFIGAAAKAICKESGMIFLFPILLGAPWSFLYNLLPFDIPGFTSPGGVGDGCIGIFHTALFMIPVFINIYILFLVINFIWNMFESFAQYFKK